ncbi:Laccase-1 OS=Emericella nidulans (strain FGSC A4 / ATCC 38163 / CBS 112,46 / NRRL 194 / M139) GN=yA PE=2 SV=3 [Rhizoctonia solani AG-1 IB]|uniref:Laccase-1 n=1 Tax=Thanatephorus cucumeris (strain AG1-IB / isolate 7/3/14) TaxID=1108050 RepID=A0A0B7FHH9_THACB|nr:Laccase-1 OS=Emericella nidulans (strain FGSC A4 / ATCC 38163 / CBS 112,46 / NRRL 194 / M139) GN=yA PE=2 SV=3 [Rhizoctonia solani AG-1 IB]
MMLGLTRFLLVVSSLAPVCYAALRQHSLVITNGTSNPDGIPRPSWLVNGQTPGPHLVWDEGDNISVTVINNGFESITIHWHGIEQYRSPWSDGVPGLTQYPIQPGQNFVYNFTVYQAGHHWYHSHSKSQLEDGLKGTIYIRPKATKAKPFSQITNDTTVLAQLKRAELDPLPLHVYDYRHHTSEYLKSEWERTDIEQLCTDNILVSDYTIRVAAVVLPQIISGHAILSYTVNGATSVGAVKTSIPPTPKTPYIDYAGTIIGGGKDLITPALSPFPATPPPQGNPSLTLNMNITRAGEFGWVLNGNKWSPPPSNAVPLLFQPGQIASLDKKVYFSYRNGSIVDLIFTVTAGNPALHPPHPIHKHGVKAWHLGSGIGEFPYPTVQAAVASGFTGINMKNPPLRDDFVTPAAITGKAWSVVRLLARDPGPVVMHCHIEPHLDTGMAVVLLEGPEYMKPGYVPSYYLNQNKL